MSAKDRFHLQGYLETAGKQQNDSLFLILVRKGFFNWMRISQRFEYKAAVFQVNLPNKLLSKWKQKLN